MDKIDTIARWLGAAIIILLVLAAIGLSLLMLIMVIKWIFWVLVPGVILWH